MSRIYRNSDTGYFPTYGLKDRIKKSRNPAQPGTGSRIVKYARRPFVPGLGLLYQITLNNDGDSLGWPTGSTHRIVSYNQQSILSVPENTLVYVAPVFYHALHNSGAWSSTTPASLRYQLSSDGDILISNSKSVTEGCFLPAGTNLLTRTFSDVVFEKQLVTGDNNFNFHLTRRNFPTSITLCHDPEWRAGFFVRIVGVFDDQDIIIDEEALAGINVVTKIAEFSFVTPPPPPAPVITSAVTSSETIRARSLVSVEYIKRFDWYLDGQFSKSTQTNKAVFSGLVNRQEYELTVKAVDVRGEESDFSDIVLATPEDPNILYTDFSEYEDGVFPEEWKDIWVTGNTWMARTGRSAAWDGNAYLYHNQSSDAHDGIIWQGIGEMKDFELVAALNPDGGFFGINGRVLFRCTDTSNSDKTCYEIAFEKIGFSNPDRIRLRKWVNNSLTTITSFPPPDADEEISSSIYKVKIRTEESSIKVKVWLKGAEEPENWDAEIEDEDLSSGYIGFAEFKGGSSSGGVIEIDSVEVKKL